MIPGSGKVNGLLEITQQASVRIRAKILSIAPIMSLLSPVSFRVKKQ